LISEEEVEPMLEFVPRKRHDTRLLCLFLVLLAPPSSPCQTAPAALKSLSLEKLSQIEVTSAGKKEEKLSGVAAALDVITQEEIRRSGVRNIPEALRLATGVEVAMFNPGSWPISARIRYHQREQDTGLHGRPQSL